jgi:twitching motility two-component system response regulator PilH
MGKILLIEDDPVQVELIKRALESRGHEVLTVRNGQGGIELAGLEKPQLILMDMIIPGMHGLEATIKLKEAEATRDIPIIALTILSNPKFVQECYRVGVADYIKKPFDPKALIESVEGIVGKPVTLTGRILIVAGVSQLATMIEMRLLRQGFEATSLAPGEFSPGRLEGEEAVAAFVDVSMPEQQIVKVFEILRASGTGKDFPIIAFAAGMNKDALSQAAARYGAQFHISAAGELGGLLRKIGRTAAR